ncbi:MAG: FKBP-type peptidyl-prolyl cis-trans isomerase [Bacteroidales bacterium]|nr:FKBP-type peptidyl-prolyl cis-trans isomerase [Bacteroidales bacterium]
MKKITTVCLCLLMVGLTSSLKSQTEMTKEQKISYAIGANMGTSINKDGINIDFDAFMQGLHDGLDNKIQFNEQEMQEIFQMLQQQVMDNRNNMTSAEKAMGKKFLEDNKTKEGVKVTASGLQYKVITEGKGDKPTATSRVTVHYKGTLLDGTVFDSTEKTGQPISFGLNQVIPGWTEGLQLMSPGAKYIFYIPSELAYGDQGAGGVIPGGATLIFEVELLSFTNE